MSAPSEGGRIGLRIAVALVALAALIGPAAPTAFGHALLLAADPADGTVLDRAPEQIRLVFTEAIAVDLSSFELVDSNGRSVALRSVIADPVDRSAIVVEPGPLIADAYRLSWKVLSNDDFHPSTGTLVFGIGVAASSATSAASTGPTVVGTLELAARWADLLALSVLVGAVVLLHLGIPAIAWSDISGSLRAAAHARGHFGRLAIVAGLISMLTGALRLAVQLGEVSPGAIVPERFLQIGFVADVLARIALTIVLVIVTFWAARVPIRRPSSLATLISITLVGVLSLVEAATTHLASIAAFPFGLIAGGIHLLAAGIWVGGLVALVVVALPLARRDPSGRAMALRIVRRFGLLAATSIAALALTGLFATGQVVASVDALFLSPYGQVLLVKVGLVGLVAMIGLRNALTTHPSLREAVARRLPARLARRLSAPQPARSIAAEMSVAVVVVGVVALLGMTPPARGPEYDPIPATARTIGVSGQADDLLVLVNVRPNRPGRNFVTIGIHDTRRPAPAPIDEVRVRLVSPDGASSGPELVARSIGNGRYEVAGDSIGSAGEWTVALTIARSGLPPASMTTPWTVVSAGVPVTQRRTFVSDQPLAPILTAAALLGTVLLAAVLAYAGYRRARVPAIPEPARGPSPVGTLEGWPG